MSVSLLCLALAACGGGGAGDDVGLAIAQGLDGEHIAETGAGTALTPVIETAAIDPEIAPDLASAIDSSAGSGENAGMLLAMALSEAEDASPAETRMQVAGAGGQGTDGVGSPEWQASLQAQLQAQLQARLEKARLHAQANAWSGAPSAMTTPAAAAGSGAMADPSSRYVAADRIAQEDWPGLQARVASLPAASKWIAGQRRLVDAWAGREHERADLVGGWIHDYVDPRSGMPLSWKEDTPEPAASTDPTSERIRQAWVTYMRQRNIAYTLSAARLYRATGEPGYAEWAMRQLDFYAENYGRWPLRTDDGRARMFRNGLSEAVNAFSLIDAARLLGPAAPASRARKWEMQLFRPMAENLKISAYPMNNVGLWHQAAVAAIGMRLRDETLVRDAIENPQGIRAIIAAGLTADDIWIEGSFAYNAYVIECLGKLLVQASLEGYGERFAPAWSVARRLLLSPIDYGFDDGSLPRPGDATSALRRVTEASHFQLFRLVPTYWGVQRARTSPSWEALLDPPVAAFPAGEPVLPPAATRHFPTVRMAVLRAGSWQAFVHYGQATASHAQQEALNFELHQGMTPISTDPGTVVYSSPFHTRYFRRAAAQNVPMVDGEGQSRWRPGTVTDFDPVNARLIVSQPEYSPRASAEREFQMLNSGFVTNTRVSLKGAGAAFPQPARIGEAFHTDCTIEGLSGTAAAPGQQLPASDAMSFWTVQARYTAGTSWSARLRCGAASYRLQVSGSAAQRIFVATAPTTPLPNRRNVIYYDTLATSAQFRAEVTALP